MISIPSASNVRRGSSPPRRSCKPSPTSLSNGSANRAKRCPMPSRSSPTMRRIFLHASASRTAEPRSDTSHKRKNAGLFAGSVIGLEIVVAEADRPGACRGRDSAAQQQIAVAGIRPLDRERREGLAVGRIDAGKIHLQLGRALEEIVAIAEPQFRLQEEIAQIDVLPQIGAQERAQ